MKAIASAVTHSNFELKNVAVELIPTSGFAESTSISIKDLEVLRTDRRSIPASKHGLETICGASCETGAQ